MEKDWTYWTDWNGLWQTIVGIIVLVFFYSIFGDWWVYGK